MNSCQGRGRATLKRAKNRQDVNGCTEITGDEWWWLLKIKDLELTNCLVKFTAKYCWDDPLPVISYTGDAASPTLTVGTGITVLPTSNLGQLDAYVVVDKNTTSAIDVSESGKVCLWFDVQITRTSHLNSPEVETYFRRENSRFYVMGDISQP